LYSFGQNVKNDKLFLLEEKGRIAWNKSYSYELSYGDSRDILGAPMNIA